MDENTFNPIENGSEDFALAPTAPQAQIVTVDEGENFIADLTTATRSYSSMIAETDEQKAVLFNAVNSAAERIADHVGEEITVKDVYVETVRCYSEDTGEVKVCPRIILIDPDGRAFQCVSVGIFSALKKMFTIFGTPEMWAAPRRIRIRQINRGTWRILTFDVIA